MDLHVGTSGYSSKEWKGSFYPEDLNAKEMLRFYGERLTAVEINNTFYRLPRAEVLEAWAEQVPERFRFSIKASRKITHFARLKPEARDPTEYLLSSLETLGQRLGVVLFQLPPNFKRDTERLAAFLEILPPGMPAAFEFRHESWDDDGVHAALRERGMALVCADTDDGDEDAAIVETGPLGYLRLRRVDYSVDDLRRWADRLRATSWDEAFVFFKHEDEPSAPRLAARFAEVFAEGGS